MGGSLRGGHRGCGSGGSGVYATLGIVRDVVGGRPSVVLSREIYVSAAALGSAVFVLARLAGLQDVSAGVFGVLSCFALRGGALAFGWSLPGYSAGEEAPPSA